MRAFSRCCSARACGRSFGARRARDERARASRPRGGTGCSWRCRAGEHSGYVCTGTFREKAAYETCVETSIYLRPAAAGRGIGRSLYAALFEALCEEDVQRTYAGSTLPNPSSVALRERIGFVPLARFGEVGRNFGRYHAVAGYERAQSS
jgi:phosphinothricin acetyltransferase